MQAHSSESCRGAIPVLPSQLLCCQELPEQAQGYWLPAPLQPRLQAQELLYRLHCSALEMSSGIEDEDP